MQGTRCHRIDPILPIHVNAVQVHTLSPFPPLLYPSFSLAWVPTHVGHLHTQGRAHTLQMPLPSPFGSDSLPSVRTPSADSSGLLSLLSSSGPFAYSSAPKFSFFPSSEARHRAVQTPTQERNSRPKSAHHQKKIPHAREREGGKGTQLGNRPAASPLLSAQLSFLRLIFSFIFDAFGGPSVR
ncbi:hypothetical protein J3E68DRAFT_147187 [Trichoderma sp. SZMC 28012]